MGNAMTKIIVDGTEIERRIDEYSCNADAQGAIRVAAE